MVKKLLFSVKPLYSRGEKMAYPSRFDKSMLNSLRDEFKAIADGDLVSRAGVPLISVSMTE